MFLRHGRQALMASVSLLVLATSPGLAQSESRPADGRTPSAQDEITVSAERTPSTVFNSPGTVTVINERQIDQNLVQGPRDIARNEPGLAVSNAPTRVGAGSFFIRGIGDNRVRLEVDGLRVPDYPGSNVGPGLYTRDIIDYDSLKAIEVIRGPASALYGSDAIGGVVTFVTKDPGDYLREVGRDWYAGTKLSFDSVNRSFAHTYTGAARRGPFEFLFQYTRRDGTETLINSATRRANPQTFQSNNILAKLIYETPDSGRWRLTGEALWRGFATDIVSARTATITQQIAHDTNKRFRLSLDWTQQLSWAIADEIKVAAYATDFDRQEHLDEYRRTGVVAPAPANRLRVSDFDFRQQIFGANAQFTAQRQWGGWDHRIIYGASVDFTMTSRPRERFEVTWPGGTPVPLPPGEIFPNKNIPDTRTTQAAFYIQDIMQWGARRIIPAVRFDYYHLNPKPDQAFFNSNPGFRIGNVSAFAVSPKLGATYDLNENFRVFGQYARGFRAPPYDNANFAFSNALQGYEILPNFGLKPETVDSFEAGLRGRFADGSSFQVSGFYNLYKDFINTATICAPPTCPLLRFQYQNLSSVRIWGFEGRGEWRMTPEWSLHGAVAYANGTDQTTGAPLDSVDPLTGVAGIRYTSPHNWQVEARMKAALAKTRVSAANIYQPGAYATFDLLGSYEINKNVTLRAGVFNIFNARYFNAIDVAGLTSNSATLELFRAPGRSVSASLSAKF
ncbi:MAG: TonB-dependent hemoglobin/transferrin/lactoferrin family receptor [Phreatobacter sp.]|nr:TonB-dependent hemoglobin/transferrin/lactoferrin family receptor [Phreatobacter sp.]